MNKVTIEDFQQVIRATHGADAKLAASEHVHERFQGETVWEGDVLVFELLDHPQAKRCYAWAVGRRVTAVLGTGPIDSAVKAVRASILAEAEG